MAVQAGFVAGTLVSALLTLPDRVNVRRLFATGCTVGALSNAAIAVADSAGAAIALRFLTGAALACVYPPGMKLAASWVAERRGTALGVLIGALTLGSGFPHALAFLAPDVGWRILIYAASVLAVAGGLLVLVVVDDGPYFSRSARFDPRAALDVFRRRGTRLATLGYLGHMWELYAMWTWIATFAAASFGNPEVTTRAAGSLVAATTIGAGAIGCVAAGVWADRIGKARVAAGAMLTSGGCALLAGAVFGAPSWILYAFGVVWGFSVVADSAQFSALVAEHSPPDHVGTALTIQTCTGFLLTMATIRLVPIVASHIGWQWAFLILAPGPLAGSFAMHRLMRFQGESEGSARSATLSSS
jgi:MFS family permease